MNAYTGAKAREDVKNELQSQLASIEADIKEALTKLNQLEGRKEMLNHLLSRLHNGLIISNFIK